MGDKNEDKVSFDREYSSKTSFEDKSEIERFSSADKLYNKKQRIMLLKYFQRYITLKEKTTLVQI